jgi:hypothetical protein
MEVQNLQNKMLLFDETIPIADKFGGNTKTYKKGERYPATQRLVDVTIPKKWAKLVKKKRPDQEEDEDQAPEEKSNSKKGSGKI